MYVETACFDPQEEVVAVSAMELQLHEHHMSLNLNNNNNSTNNNTHLMQQVVMINQHPNLVHLPYDDHDHHYNNWDPVHHHIFNFTHSLHHQHHQDQHREEKDQNDHHLSFNIANTSSSPSFSHQTPDLLFNLLLNSSTISLADPLFHLNLPQHHHDIDDAFTGRGRRVGGKRKKPFTTTGRQRRVQLNNQYQYLRALLPNPTKVDKASVVGDAIEYIRELLGTVSELKLLVDKKRRERSREKKRLKTEEGGGGGGGGGGGVVNGDQSYNDGPLRSSWLQKKSKDTEVDIRIVDDEVTIKLVRRKKIDCLLFVSKALK